MVTVEDLEAHQKDRNKFLYCEVCGSRYSADYGDYSFRMNPDDTFTCCDTSMVLAREICNTEVFLR